jgi:hypothetical protein
MAAAAAVPAAFYLNFSVMLPISLLLYWLSYPGSYTVYKHVDIDKALITFVEYEEQCFTEGGSCMFHGILSRKWQHR